MNEVLANLRFIPKTSYIEGRKEQRNCHNGSSQAKLCDLNYLVSPPQAYQSKCSEVKQWGRALGQKWDLALWRSCWTYFCAAVHKVACDTQHVCVLGQLQEVLL
jgi:hypothetical protein